MMKFLQIYSIRSKNSSVIHVSFFIAFGSILINLKCLDPEVYTNTSTKLKDILQYIESIEFAECPDCSLIQKKLKETATAKGWNLTLPYDWEALEDVVCISEVSKEFPTG